MRVWSGQTTSQEAIKPGHRRKQLTWNRCILKSYFYNDKSCIYGENVANRSQVQWRPGVSADWLTTFLFFLNFSCSGQLFPPAFSLYAKLIYSPPASSSAHKNKHKYCRPSHLSVFITLLRCGPTLLHRACCSAAVCDSERESDACEKSPAWLMFGLISDSHPLTSSRRTYFITPACVCLPKETEQSKLTKCPLLLPFL